MIVAAVAAAAATCVATCVAATTTSSAIMAPLLPPASASEANVPLGHRHGGERVQALDGFFLRQRLHPPAPEPGSPRLFQQFALATSSWAALEEKRRAVEHELARWSPRTTETTAASQVKIVYFIRHAEGYHNVAERELGTARWEAVEAKDPRFLDAELTPVGVADAQAKGPPALEAEAARGMPPIERVVVSPLSRAIETAEAFLPGPLAPRPFVAIESCRETLGVHTCDRRRPRSTLTTVFPDVDFSRLAEDDDQLWSPTHRETRDELERRARVFLEELFTEVPERHVAVVAHSGFISAVWSLLHNGDPLHSANCEVVPLALALSDDDDAAVAAAAAITAVE